MSGIIAVYGLVIAVLIANAMSAPVNNTSLYTTSNICSKDGVTLWFYMLHTDRRFMHLACWPSVGLTGIAAGYTIGVVGDAVRLPAGFWTTELDAIYVSRVFEHTCNNPGSTWE